MLHRDSTTMSYAYAPSSFTTGHLEFTNEISFIPNLPCQTISPPSAFQKTMTWTMNIAEMTVGDENGRSIMRAEVVCIWEKFLLILSAQQEIPLTKSSTPCPRCQPLNTCPWRQNDEAHSGRKSVSAWHTRTTEMSNMHTGSSDHSDGSLKASSSTHV